MLPFRRELSEKLSCNDDISASLYKPESVIDQSALVNLKGTTLQQVVFIRHLELNMPIFDVKLKVNVSFRESLVNWFFNVHSEFMEHMSLRTIFFAIALVDRYAQQRKMPLQRQGLGGVTSDEEVKLLGATCLHIASKCEDVSYIGIKDLAEQTENIFEPKQILLMEEKVLNALSFDVYIPTVIDFVSVYLECVSEMAFPSNPIAPFLIMFITESLLLSNDAIEQTPSILAYCVIRYAMLCLDIATLPDALMSIAQCTRDCHEDPTYKRCLAIVRSAHIHAKETSDTSLRQRYLITPPEVATVSREATEIKPLRGVSLF